MTVKTQEELDELRQAGKLPPPRSAGNNRLLSLQITSLIGLIQAAQTFEQAAQIVQNEVRDYEYGGSDVPPDSFARAVATILATQSPGLVTDGTFALKNVDGTFDPVEYPLTFAGITNAINEQAGREGVSLEFRPGPNGAWATAEAEAKAAWDAEREFAEAVTNLNARPISNTYN